MRHTLQHRPRKKLTHACVCVCAAGKLFADMQQQQQPQQLRVTRDELQAVDDLLLAVRGAVLIQDVDAATTTADTAHICRGTSRCCARN